MSIPLIGLITSRIKSKGNNNLLSVLEAYVQAVDRAGAAPLLIPLGLPKKTLLSILERLDGVLFTGGGDVEPNRFGGDARHPKLGEVDPDRDRVEILLIQEAIERGMPFLGICRGIQVINVALGGSLYVDIADQMPKAIKHDYYRTKLYSTNYPRNHLAHPVRVEPSSRLGLILGSSEVSVNSLHHQGVERLAPSLQATARSTDGLVEGIELPGHPFALAAQWHPEWMPEHAPMRAIFSALVEAAARSRR